MNLYESIKQNIKESAYGTIYLAEVGYNGVVGTCRGIGHTPEEARMNAFKLFKKDYPYIIEELMKKDDFKDMSEIDAVRKYYSINTFDMSSGASNESNSHL